MARFYRASALGGAISAVWCEAEARELFEHTPAKLREGDLARGFKVWAPSEMGDFRLAPCWFTPIADPLRRERWWTRVRRRARRGNDAPVSARACSS